ncbi:MAG TPA: flagellar basal body rod protein FlgB [Chloroflexota bacterium]|nr:flagellar basal body rod protein FlgB [Chloroflexota bacterium]
MPDVIRHDLTTKLLEKALDGLSLRQQAISNNMANVDTPNFKATEVSFEEDLAAAIRRQPSPDTLELRTSDSRHIGAFEPVDATSIQPRATQLLTTSMRNDGNNVDVDREMTRLAETQLFFQAATQLVNVKFNQLKQAIWEGKR